MKFCHQSLLVLSLSLCGGSAQLLSQGGCACTSSCDKGSWLRASKTTWCYVDKACKPAGWDSCHDAQTQQFMSAVNAKAQAEQNHLEEKLKREDAEKHGADVQAQLDSATVQLKDARLLAASLKREILELRIKEDGAEKKASGAELKAQKVEAEEQEVQKSAQLKIKSLQQKLQEAEKVKDSGREVQAELKQEMSKESNTEKKLEEAEQKESSVEKKLHEAQQTLQKDEMQHSEDVKKVQGMQTEEKSILKKLQQNDELAKESSDKMKMLAKEFEDYKASSEKALAEAVRKQTEAEDKLAKETAKLKDVEATEKKLAKVEAALKEVEEQRTEINELKTELKQAHEKEHEEEAELTQEREKEHQAQVDTKMYKIFKDAQLKAAKGIKQHKN